MAASKRRYNRKWNIHISISRQNIRERLIHLLAIRPIEKVQLYKQLEREGVTDHQKRDVPKVLEEIAILKGKAYDLRAHMWDKVDNDWPYYTIEDRRYMMLRKYSQTTTSASVTSSSVESINSTSNVSSTNENFLTTVRDNSHDNKCKKEEFELVPQKKRRICDDWETKESAHSEDTSLIVNKSKEYEIRRKLPYFTEEERHQMKLKKHLRTSTSSLNTESSNSVWSDSSTSGSFRSTGSSFGSTSSSFGSTSSSTWSRTSGFSSASTSIRSIDSSFRSTGTSTWSKNSDTSSTGYYIRPTNSSTWSKTSGFSSASSSFRSINTSISSISSSTWSGSCNASLTGNNIRPTNSNIWTRNSDANSVSSSTSSSNAYRVARNESVPNRYETQQKKQIEKIQPDELFPANPNVPSVNDFSRKFGLLYEKLLTLPHGGDDFEYFVRRLIEL
ncbi:RNA polymerase II elongation factor Ell-like [Ceratitis capitata]|uniref:(Mediterranean fruit fly) hypothetical protein n=1 Tax=Ceratitis capitata TaxID=7213 RepID=A0A811TZ12_CERCA|nr:RNA polymerase II elongation factor Ell-like [Ceratitis capitata]CAD6991388.1 unnamed protein product [Ceratitis capitata]